MKKSLLFLSLICYFNTFSQIHELSGTIEVQCPSTTKTVAYDIIAPYDTRFELITGDWVITGNSCQGGSNGESSGILVSEEVLAIWVDENGNTDSHSIGGTGTVDPDNLGLFKTNTVRKGTIIRLYLTLTIDYGFFANGNYTLKYILPRLTYESDDEPNDDYTQAIETVESTFYEGHGGTYAPFYNEGIDWYNDWYKLTAPRNGTLTITVYSDNLYDDFNDTNLEILNSRIDGYTEDNSTSFLIGGGVASGNGTFITTNNCVKVGDIIYLKFNGDSNSYRFNWSIDEPIGYIDTEPNNTFVQAISIIENETKTGNIGFGLSFDSNNLLTEDLEDWYTFTTDKQGQLNFNFSTSDNTGSTKIEDVYYKNYDNILIAIAMQGGAGVYFVECNPEGTYYIKVKTPSTQSNLSSCEDCCATYSLSWSITEEPTYQNDNEPNNTLITAQYVDANTDHDGRLYYDFFGDFVNNDKDNIDYYELHTSYNGSLDISFTEPLQNASAHMVYIDNGQEVLIGNISYDSNNNITSIGYPCAAEGEIYYLIISSSSCLSYQFSYTNTLSVNTENEPNNDISNAELLGEFDNMQGQVGYGQGSFIDNYDYFKLNITESAPLTYSFNTDGVQISLFENDIPIVDLENNSTEISYNNIDASNTYYLQIFPNSSCGNYGLLGWQQAFTAINDSEPNNDSTEALVINFNQTYQGRLTYLSTSTDSEDFYKFNLVESDMIDITFNAFEGLEDTAKFTILNESLTQVYEFLHSKSGSKSTLNFVANLTAGNYFIKISGTSETGSYNFELNPQNVLSTTDFELKKNILVYPNPSNSIITIQNNSGQTIQSISMYNMVGTKVKVFKNPESRINISNLTSGIYFLQLKTDIGVANKKLIVNK